MKTKCFILAMAMTVATGASAQFVSKSGKSSGSFSSSNVELDPKSHFVADFKIGSVASKGGFGFNLGGTKELTSFAGCTLAWDFVNVEWAAPFSSPGDLDYISAKTGLRLFSPSFMNDNLRLYTNLSMGYTCVLTKGSSELVNAILKYDSTSGISRWMEGQGYSKDEIGDVLDELDDIADDIEDGDFDDEDEEFAAWENALRNHFGGKMEAHHGFGLTWGIGVQIKKKFNIGYTLQYETAFKSKNHFATFGYTF